MSDNDQEGQGESSVRQESAATADNENDLNEHEDELNDDLSQNAKWL